MSHTQTAEAPVLDVDVVDHKTLADTPLAKFFQAAVKYETSDLIMRGGQAPSFDSRAISSH